MQSLGYTAERAQLFTVPRKSVSLNSRLHTLTSFHLAYAVACVLTFIVAYLSDRLWLRGPVILCCLPFSIAGYAMVRMRICIWRNIVLTLSC